MGLSTWKTYSGINKGMNSNWFSFTGIIPSVSLFLWRKERVLFVVLGFFFPPSFFSCSLVNNVLELIHNKSKTTPIISEQECSHKNSSLM